MDILCPREHFSSCDFFGRIGAKWGPKTVGKWWAPFWNSLDGFPFLLSLIAGFWSTCSRSFHKGDNYRAFGCKGVSGYGCPVGAVKGCRQVGTRTSYQVKETGADVDFSTPRTLISSSHSEHSPIQVPLALHIKRPNYSIFGNITACYDNERHFYDRQTDTNIS